MISGSELFEIAQKLTILRANGSEEARCRSAVSRVYYAAFHWAVEFLAEFAIQISQNSAGHKEVVRYIMRSGLPDAEAIGRAIDHLRSLRNRADYVLSCGGFESCELAKSCIEDVSELKATLASWRGDPTAAQSAFQKLKSDPTFRK